MIALLAGCVPAVMWIQNANLRHYDRMSMWPWGMARIFRKLLVSLALIATAHCQTSRGKVTGTVLDSSGAAIKGANVALTSRRPASAWV